MGVDKKDAKWLKKRKWWKPEHTKLQAILDDFILPNTHLVASRFYDDSNVINKILSGESQLRFGTKVIVQLMQPSTCHGNVRYLYENGYIKELHTGFALSSDGKWRFHSWGIGFDDIIVETTELRLAYLTGECVAKSS